MSETLNTVNMDYTYKYPWKRQQYATVVAAGLLTLGFGAFMLNESGMNPVWYAVIALAPFASLWSWRTNVSRKNRSAVVVNVKDGNLKCTSEANDNSTGIINLNELHDIYVATVDEKKVITLVAGDGRARIPVRAVGEGSPVISMLRNAAEVTGADVSKEAKELLGF